MREDVLRKRQGERLIAARKAAGYKSARAAAVENGWPVSTYSAHERGDRTIGQDDADQYVRRFRALGANASAQEILFGPQAAPTVATAIKAAQENISFVPRLDWVSAGRLANPSSQIPVEQVPLLAFADLGRGEFFALTVRGDSMDRVSPEGSTIVVNRNDRRLVTNKFYVFEVNGETTYKMWPGGDPLYLSPHSTNPLNRPIFPKRKRDVTVIGRVVRSVVDL